jgi:hypothetical protein
MTDRRPRPAIGRALLHPVVVVTTKNAMHLLPVVTTAAVHLDVSVITTEKYRSKTCLRLM